MRSSNFSFLSINFSVEDANIRAIRQSLEVNGTLTEIGKSVMG